MISYQRRDEERRGRNLLAGAVGVAGLVAALRHPGTRSAIGSALLRSGNWLGSEVERYRFGGVSQRFRASLNATAESQPLKGGALWNAIEGNKRTGEANLLRIARRDYAVNAAHSQLGMAASDAHIIFGEHGINVDIFREGLGPTLGHSRFANHLRPGLSAHANSLLQGGSASRSTIETIIDLAKEHAVINPTVARSFHRTATDGVIHRFGEASTVNRILSNFGLRKQTLGQMVGNNFANLAEHHVSQGGASSFGQLTNLVNPSSDAEKLYLSAAWSHRLGGGNDFGQIRSLATEVITNGQGMLNLGPFQQILGSVGTLLDQHTHIPLAPGMGGISPLKLFPWTRGRTRDSSGTIRFGTHLPTLRTGLAAQGFGGVSDIFDERGVLQRDLHFSGKSLIDSVTGDILPGKWDFLDDYRGYGQKVSQIMRAEAASSPSGRLRSYLADNWQGGANALDFLHLDRQAEASKFSRAYSGVARYVDPGDPSVANHPLVLMDKFINPQQSMGMSEVESGVEHLLQNIKRHTTLGKHDNVSEIFTEDLMRRAGVSENLIDLITGEGGLSGERMSTSLRNIDDLISGGSVGAGAIFTSAMEAKRAYGSGLGMVARRFSQNEADVLGSLEGTAGQAGILNLEGLLGVKGSLSGEEIMREHFLEAALTQMMDSHNEVGRVGHFRELMGNTLRATRAMGGGSLTATEGEGIRAGMWARTNLAALHASDLTRSSRAIDVALQMNTEGPLMGDVRKVLESNFGGIRPWVTPDPAGRGLGVYVVPEGQGVSGALKDTWDLINSAFSGGSSDYMGQLKTSWQNLMGEHGGGYGAAQHPGELWHSGVRINGLLESMGLGLPDTDMQTTQSLYTNLVMRRVLPAFGAVEAWKYLNFKTNDVFGISPIKGIASLRAQGAIQGSQLMDTLGLTPGLKRFTDMIPGLDNYINPMTADEQEKYQTEGYDPVRSGRYWFAGSRGLWKGGKIQYWSPTQYQMQTSDWQGASNVDLNSKWYWQHKSIIPNLDNPLAPLNLLDPYAWENRHSVGPHADRPYVVSGPLADPGTIVGQAVNMTIGPILKPTRILHREYLKGSTGSGYGNHQVASENYVRFMGSDYKLYSGEGRMVGGGDPEDVGAGSGWGPGGGGSGGGSGNAYGPGGKSLGLQGNGSGGFWGGGGKFSGFGDGRPVDGRAATEAQMAYSGYGRTVGIRPDQTDYPVSGPNDLNTATRRFVHMGHDIEGLYGFFKGTGLDISGFGGNSGTAQYATPDQAYGWEHRFWSRNLGGLGGDLSEMWRRVVPHKDRNQAYENSVPNLMPDWLSGDEDLFKLRRGDPYTQIAMGEVRLPGDAYERIHHPRLYQTRASALGGTPEEIAESMFRVAYPGQDEDDNGSYATRMGDKIHAAVQKEMEERGILLSMEERIHDPDLGASGHYDALINYQGKKVVAEIKSMGAEKYDAAEQPYEKHRTQLNFYLKNLQMDSGMLIYVDRDDPTRVKTFDVNYDPSLYKETQNKVLQAHRIADKMIKSGKRSRFDMYEAIDRAEILLGAQAWSDRARTAVADAQQQIEDENDPEHKEYLQDRLTAARKRASKQRQLYQIHNYKFNQETETQDYTVKEIINPNVIRVEEGNQLIKLAGVSVSKERILKHMQAQENMVMGGMSQMEAFYASMGIATGKKIRVVVGKDIDEEDPDSKFVRGAIIAKGRNVNSRLISMGVGKENEDDDSAAGVYARYSTGDRLTGRFLESIAHVDTPLNRKLLGADSALELYKRTQVYGTVAGDWAHPFKTYLSPTIDAMASRNALFAPITGAMVASYFGKTEEAKATLAIAGFGLGAIMSGKRAITELVTGKPWIPGRVRKRREVEEYYDTLKYMKAKGLEEYFAKRSHQNLKRLLNDKRDAQDNTLTRIEELESEKAEILYSGNSEARTKERAKWISAKIAALRSRNSEVKRLDGNATLALYYHKEAKKTLMGARPGDPLQLALSGVPRYEREMIQGVIAHGSKKEKSDLYRLLSDREKSVLGVYLGKRRNEMPVKESLDQYFQHHQLPDASWAAWAPATDLNNARVLTAKEEGITPMEMGIYPRNLQDAEIAMENIPVPVMDVPSFAVHDKIKSVLRGAGLRNVQIDFHMTQTNNEESSSDFQVDITHDRTNQMIRSIR